MNCQKVNQIKNTLFIMIVGVIGQIIFWSLVAPVVGASPSNIRGLELSEVDLPKAIPCNSGTMGSNCTCPANCLMYVAETGGCHPIDCWSYSTIKSDCNEAGKEWLPAMVLQGIPVTGVFGSGFGNMGRWDIFGIYMAIMFGGCFGICCCACLCSACNKEADKEAMSTLGSKGCGCLISVAILVMYIWGIVVIANKDVDAPWTNYKGEDIMCPMID